MPSARATIARLFFAGLPGPDLDAETRRLHAAVPFGGVVLFRRNVGAPRPTRDLVRALHGLDPSLPPLIAIDHEGGRVHRFAPPFTAFPSAAEVAVHGVRSVRAVARAMARELAAVGIDVVFAPVLDVASNPANPVIGDRAFATIPEAAATLGLAAHRALRSGGLITCGKHFPGHGDTSTDSHLVLPVVTASRATLNRRELHPFRRAVAARIPMLMTAHVRYPALDPGAVATLSKPILTDLLRGRLGFTGVVCSDDLEMRAITDHHDPAEAAVRALAAGVDALLFCQGQEALREAVDAVERAVGLGRLPESRIVDAHRRVVALARWRARRPHRVSLAAIGCHAHRTLAAEVGAGG